METIDITDIDIDDLELCDYELQEMDFPESYFSWMTCDKCGLRKYVLYNELLIYSFEIDYKNYVIYFPFNKIIIRNKNYNGDELIISLFTEETDIKELIKNQKTLLIHLYFYKDLVLLWKN